jgi:hypothetical protein
MLPCCNWQPAQPEKLGPKGVGVRVPLVAPFFPPFIIPVSIYSIFMKFDDIIISAKLFCVFAGTSLLALQTGLGQWSNSEDTPSKVQWTMILGGSLGTGFIATGAFLSNAFGNYTQNRTSGSLPP